jgi:hypothetical protein
LQKKFSYIKAQSIGNYVKLLDKSSVAPSSKTQQLLREDKAAAEEESEDSDSDHHESSFGNLSLQEYSGKEDHSLLSPTLSPTLSPASFLSPSSMGTPIRSNAIFSSPPQLNPISSPERFLLLPHNLEFWRKRRGDAGQAIHYPRGYASSGKEPRV